MLILLGNTDHKPQVGSNNAILHLNETVLDLGLFVFILRRIYFAIVQVAREIVQHVSMITDLNVAFLLLVCCQERDFLYLLQIKSEWIILIVTGLTGRVFILSTVGIHTFRFFSLSLLKLIAQVT